jgi:tRNA U55 pseudouridine synthase TruB
MSPAATSVRIAVEMPLRRSQVHALDVIAYTGRSVRLSLHVGSGTYVRSIAAALGGHCVSLRRTEIGPFHVDECDETRVVPLEEALPRLAAVRDFSSS